MLSSRESPRPGPASSLSVSPSLSAPSAGPGSENNLGASVLEERFDRWCLCSLCEQRYHGVVYHALGWACWKTYVGRPETSILRQAAIASSPLLNAPSLTPTPSGYIPFLFASV